MEIFYMAVQGPAIDIILLYKVYDPQCRMHCKVIQHRLFLGYL